MYNNKLHLMFLICNYSYKMPLMFAIESSSVALLTYLQQNLLKQYSKPHRILNV